MTVRAMLPDHRQIAEVESGRLGVCNVGFTLLIDENAAAGTDALWPAKVKHPAHHIEHVNAHIAHDAVAIFHKGSPAARVNELVVRPHRCWPGPHLVIEVI